MKNPTLRFARRETGLLVLALGAIGCGGRDQSRQPSKVAVGTFVVRRQALAVEIDVTATTVARPGGIATLAAPAPARVARVYVSPGDRVSRGQPLVAFERAPFEAAHSQAAAAARTAREAFARASRLLEQGIAPRRDVEQTRAALAAAEAALVVARRSLDLATLRAPISGVVSRLTAVLDASVGPSQALVEIVDPSATELELLLAPNDAARVAPGAPVRVVTAGASPDSGVEAAVVSIGATVDSVVGGVRVRARLVGSHRLLRIGETMPARVQLELIPDAVVIPAASLVPDGDGYRVYVVTPGDTARARPVLVGSRADSLVQVQRGVVPGDLVVTEGAYGVDDGSPVIRSDAGRP